MTLLALSSSPAFAAEEPTVEWPVQSEIVEITGPEFIWWLRVYARALDPYLDTVDFKFVDQCSGNNVCLTVNVDNYGTTGWNGQAIWNTWYDTEIRLNTYYSSREWFYAQGYRPTSVRFHYMRFVALHELMHILGMPHYNGSGGVMSVPKTSGLNVPIWPSESEMEALVTFYNE